ncbi:type II secretion system F family protein [Trinickia sp. YCB016]
MKTFDVISLLALMLLLGWAALALAGPRSRVRTQIAQRMRQATSLGNAAPAATSVLRPADLKRGLFQRVAALGERVPMLDPTQRDALKRKLIRAGFRDHRALSTMIGLKLLSGALAGLAALFLAPMIPRFGEYLVIRLIAMAGGFVIGLILPEYALGALISRRRKKISACLADALDLLVICTNAGNSLAVSVKRVAHELRNICAPLSDELTLTADELQIGSDQATALRNLAARTDVPSVHALATTLIQSQQYGTPITQALRTLSHIERTDQLTALEEKSAKLATKITLPMMLFILPTVGLIAAGPAVIRLLAVFRAQ